jgi:autotransporter-associated beta strand protein
MKFSGWQSYTGGTTVNAGTLELAGQSGGNGWLRGAVTVNAGGTLLFSGGDGTGFGWNSPVTSLTVDGGTFDAAGGAHVGFGSYMTVALNNGGTISGTGQWNGDGLLGFSSSGDSTNTINGSWNLRSDNGANHTFNVADGAAATDLQVNAALGDQSPEVWWVSASALVKTGSGTMVLAGNNSYNGATIVSAGTLLVSGALGDSAVSVNGGGFGGTGTVGSNLTINSGLFHVANLFDPLAVNGTISLFSGFGIDDLAGLDWGSVSEGTYTLITGTLGSGVFSGLSNNSLASAYDIGGGRSAYFQEGSLQLVVIPEPGAALLGGLGMLALLRRKR